MRSASRSGTATWDTWRWRALFRVFFSRTVMGRLGRDPEFFRYVDVPVSERLMARGRYAGTELDPADNPYAQWIFTGTHTNRAPARAAARELRDDPRQPRSARVAPAAAGGLPRRGRCPSAVDAFNLSDIFEYMSEAERRARVRPDRRERQAGRTPRVLEHARAAQPPGLAGRPDRVDCRSSRRELFAQDKAYFYSAFVVEEVIG